MDHLDIRTKSLRVGIDSDTNLPFKWSKHLSIKGSPPLPTRCVCSLTYMLFQPRPCLSLPAGPRGGQMLLHTYQSTCMRVHETGDRWCNAFIQILARGLTSYFVHGLAPLTCRTRQKLRALHPSAVGSLQPPVSDPGAPSHHRAGPK